MSKKKKKDNKPQLSKFDKFIYNSIFIILIILVFVLITNFFPLINKLYFLQEGIIASTQRFTIILSLPFLLIISLTPLEILIENQTKHKAIFGNKSIDYRSYSTQLRPIFGKERNKIITDKQKKTRNRKIVSWFIAFIVLAVISILGIFGRTVLTSDGEIVTYSVFNNIKEEYQIKDISKVEYSTYYSSGGRYTPDTYDYSVEIHILNSDESYSFDNQSFKNTKQDNISICLIEMIRLKEEVYKNKIITFDIKENLSEIAEYNDFNDKETELLYKLFEIEE